MWLWLKRMWCKVFGHWWSVVCETDTMEYGKTKILYLRPPLVFICTRCGHREEKM